jgi:hypothetical protein
MHVAYKSKMSIIGKTARSLFQSNLTFTLFTITLVGLFLRLPSLNSELPPYVFCDEQIWLEEVLRMKEQNTFTTQVFISGALNTYPIYLISSIIELFMTEGLSSTQILILGRATLTLGSFILSCLSLFYVTRKFTQSSFIALGSVTVFSVAPYAVSQNRLWYPDHYMSIASIWGLYTIILLYRNLSKKTSIIFGIFLGVSVSIKYTLLYLFLSFLFVQGIYLIRGRIDVRKLLRLNIYFFVTFLFIFLMLNFSIIVNPRLFYNQLNFNLDLYPNAPGIHFGGIAFYVILLLLITATPVAALPLFFGIRKFWVVNRLLFSVILVPIVFYIITLGRSDHLINRNINLFIPLICVLIAIGLKELLSFHVFLAKVNLILLIFFVGWQNSFILSQEIKPDSYAIAERWIEANVAMNATIGVNWSCEAGNPADSSHSTVLLNDYLDLDYYVFSSYWSNPFDDFYREKSIIQELNPKNLHYYHYGDDQPLNFRMNRPALSELTPFGYKIVAKITGNGPDFIIIRRTRQSTEAS